MRLSTEVPEIARWPDVRGPLHIACSRDAMEQLRRRALTGLKAPPVAGFGVGGLLLGEREGSSVRVLDSLALECSHSLGPPFRLTPPEVRRSRELILANGALPVIGWYFSRTQGELELSRAEVALFEELFPSQWQITLLLLPDAGESARAAFFFREPAGDMVKAAEEIMRPWLSDVPSQVLSQPHDPRLPRFLSNPEAYTNRRSTSAWSWILIAIIALAAGAAFFMFQNSTASRPQPAPTTQIP